MASYNRRTKRKYPNSSRPVDGNLARNLTSRELERQLDRSGQMDFDQLYERQPETAAERNARRRAQQKAAQRPALHISPAVFLGAACIGFMTVVLLLCYVRLNTISRSIVSMKTEIKKLEVEQVSLLTEYEQTFDLSAVKEAAASAGMTQPSDSQIFYINLPGEDQAKTYHTEANPLRETVDSLVETAKELIAKVLE